MSSSRNSVPCLGVDGVDAFDHLVPLPVISLGRRPKAGVCGPELRANLAAEVAGAGVVTTDGRYDCTRSGIGGRVGG